MLESQLNIEACPTATAAGRIRVVYNLEFGPNQLGQEVDLAALQEVQGRDVEYDLGHARLQPWLGWPFVSRELEDDIILADNCRSLRLLRKRHKVHSVLEPVAAAAFHHYAKREVRVRFSFHDVGQPLMARW